MSIATFIQEAKDAGFTDKQTVMLLDKFDERKRVAITRDTLRAEIAESEARVKSFVNSIEVRVYIAGITVLAPIYAKLFGVI